MVRTNIGAQILLHDYLKLLDDIDRLHRSAVSLGLNVQDLTAKAKSAVYEISEQVFVEQETKAA